MFINNGVKETAVSAFKLTPIKYHLAHSLILKILQLKLRNSQSQKA